MSRPKIFILKPSSLGDVIQALPVLRLLRLHLPQSEIFWWIDSGLASLLETDPDLTGVVRFDRQRWRSPWHWGEIWASVQALRRQRFDWVIDLQSLLRSGAMAWLTNGSLTVGLDDPREGARGFYDIVVPRPNYHTHAVDWYLHSLPPLGVPVHWSFTWLPANSEAAAQVQARRTEVAPAGARWIALQPGARWENKRWPLSHFAQTVRQLAAEAEDVRFLILGGEGDRTLGQALAAAAPKRCLDLTGQTSLPQMIEWLRIAELLITNDTGPMHAAAALGKPVVALFGPTEPRRTGPYGQVADVLRQPLPCVPCMRDSCHWPQPMECLQAITPDIVLGRVRMWLTSGQQTKPTLKFGQLPLPSTGKGPGPATPVARRAKAGEG
ncbi:MAG TPA: glycosyltransferase family 9 protein [Verrucomicrobiae bacterium]|nr:glycosyltransferase family 9 protein [Verrucomicrobiae bacterium]